jgi:hypothetical protein
VRGPLLVLVLLAGCGRTTEFIGSIPVSAAWNCGPRCFRDENLQGLDLAGFAATDDPLLTNRPELRYPLPGAVHPLNVREITFSWRSAPGIDHHYRLHFARGGQAYDFHVPCRPPEIDPLPPGADECTYAMPAAAWAAMAEENAGGALTLTITGAKLAAGAVTPLSVATADPVPLAFSPAPIEAGLYYRSDAEGAALWRAWLGGGTQPFFKVATADSRFGCAGCHSVSRDGHVLAFSAERQYLGVAQVDEPGKLQLAPATPPRADAATQALNADGSLVAASDGAHLEVRATSDGHLVASSAARLYFPEWSPDGSSIAATLATRAENAYSVNDGSIVVLPFTGTGLGEPRVVAAGDATSFHFQPSWSPDGQWIVFASAPVPGRSYDNPQSRLRLVRASGGAVIALDGASGGLGASWPRFAPVSHAGGNVFYVSFDSKLDAGYQLRNAREAGGGHAQVWLTTLDLRRAGDPSSAPVWLPFQFLYRHVTNNLAVWTERLVCNAQVVCPSGTRCDAGSCKP